LPDRRQPYLAEATRRKSEKAEKADQPDLRRRKLGDRGTTIPRRQIGLARAASVLRLGFRGLPNIFVGLDPPRCILRAGGNLFDTAFVYSGGGTETLLGEWLKNRSVRERSVVIGKQLTQSLDRPQACGQRGFR
jgi:aryl-alcohol dehydrogenase-like predicted oxidoreductase